MTNLKVAFCIYKYFPFGGLQRDFLRIAKEISSRGHEVRVYVRQWDGEKPASFQIVEVPTFALTNTGKNEKYYHWVRKHLLANPVDRVVGFNRMPGLDVYFAGDVCYANANEHRNSFYKLTPRYKHSIAFEKAVFNKGNKTKILLLTESSKESFQKFYGTEANRFFVLPPGIDVERRYSNQPVNTRNLFRQEFSISSEQTLLLQVCSNYELKGVDRSIKAIADLPDEIRKNIIFFVVGQDNPEKMQLLAKKVGLEKQIRFFEGRDDIARFMLGADVMLHPAKREAAGIVILESIISGLPIIVSGLCGYAPYVKSAGAGVILSEPFRQQEYSQVLQKTLNDEPVLKQWKSNAQNYADHANLYDLARQAADIILE